MPLNKKDIKEIKGVVIEVIEPFARSTQIEFRKIDKRFDNVEHRLDGVEHRLDGVEHRLDGVENRLSEVEKDVKWMRDNVGELFSKLDKFIYWLEKHDQEILALSAQLRRLEERVDKWEAKHNKK